MSAESEPLGPLRAQAERVLESECFRNSGSLRRLLSYLVERSLTDRTQDLKEYTIGIELYGKPASYDPQKDAAIRVQLSRLRQKLEEYYQGEGSGDPYRLELPKGRFVILLHSNGHQPIDEVRTPIVRFARFAPSRVVLVAALIPVAASIVWTISLSRKVDLLESRVAAPPAIKEFASLWHGFFNPAVRNVLIFGSPPFFASTKHGVFVRMYRYTDPNDPRSSPEFGDVDRKIGPLVGPRYEYASMGDAIGALRLSRFFGARGFELQALPAHLAEWTTLQDDNLIFLGAARMNPLLRRLPIRPDFEMGPDDSVHNRNPQPGEQSVYATPSNSQTLSYAVVGYYPGLVPGREILVLTAHGSPGTVGAVEFVTSAEGVKLLREKLRLDPKEDKHFEVLLRVFPDNDVAVKTEYVTYHLIR